MYKLSVIVPLYNSQKYLERCLDSILNQTFKDFEVILVDDGSIDNSAYICDKYSSLHTNIKVIHKKNSGVSDARNEGINVAKGDFITFIDSDDIISKNMFEILMKNIESEKADLSICQVKQLKCGDFNDATTYVDDKNCLSHEETLEAILKINVFNIGPCAKIYRRHIVGDLRFESAIHINEDILFLFLYAMRCKKSVYTKAEKYFYIQREKSASRSPFTEKNLATFYVVENIVTLCKMHEPNLINDSISFALRNYLLLANKIIYSNNLINKIHFNSVLKKIEFYRKQNKQDKLSIYTFIYLIICKYTKLYIITLRLFKRNKFF